MVRCQRFGKFLLKKNTLIVLLIVISQQLNPSQDPWRPFLSREIRAKTSGIHFTVYNSMFKALGVHFTVFKWMPRNAGTQLMISECSKMYTDRHSDA